MDWETFIIFYIFYRKTQFERGGIRGLIKWGVLSDLIGPIPKCHQTLLIWLQQILKTEILQ